MSRKSKPIRKTLHYRWEDVPLILDIAYLCQLLGISGDRALRLVQSGELKARKVGNMWRINKCDLMRFMGVEEGIAS